MELLVQNVALAVAYLRTKWHLDPSSRLATTYMGRKLGVRLLLVELGLHLTMSRGLRPASMQSYL